MSLISAFDISLKSNAENPGVSAINPPRTSISSVCRVVCLPLPRAIETSPISKLDSNLNLEIGEVSIALGRGKHTTRHTELIEVLGGLIADTPGFSSFEISEIESIELDKYFREFKSEIVNCEFVGCTHIKEQNCGIKEAINVGTISQERYERFCKIYEELKEKEKYKW